MEKRQFKIISETGIHARPATLLVQTATRYDSKLHLIYNQHSVDLKSIMGVMSLGVGQNAVITVTADGSDAKQALQAISETLEKEGLTK